MMSQPHSCRGSAIDFDAPSIYTSGLDDQIRASEFQDIFVIQDVHTRFVAIVDRRTCWQYDGLADPLITGAERMDETNSQPNSDGTVDERLEELLDVYEDLQAQGRSVSAKELCPDDDELCERLEHEIRQQNEFDAFLAPQDPSDGENNSAFEAGPFRTLERHGRGGQGDVYLAQDRSLNRKVALKRMQPHMAARPDSDNRFAQEAEIAGRLEHPGVIPVYAFGRSKESDEPYYVMRFVDGPSLRDAIESLHSAKTKEEPGVEALEFQRLVRSFLAVCETVSYAHNRGIIHRDIKPGNVMLGGYGETLLVDWGLAKSTEDRQQAAQTESIDDATAIGPAIEEDLIKTTYGQQKGALPYMSPEQARGDVDSIGPQSDIYSLGATLYSILTGHNPVSGSTKQEVLSKVRNSEFPPPRERNPLCPRALEAICLKAMANNPANRYASAEELADDVERWLADEPVSAWEEPIQVRSRRWMRRKAPLVAASLAALVMLAIGTGVVAIQQSRSSRKLAGKNEELSEKNETLVKVKDALKAENAAKGRVIGERDTALTVLKKSEAAERKLKAVAQKSASEARKAQLEAERIAAERSVTTGEFNRVTHRWDRAKVVFNEAARRLKQVQASTYSADVGLTGVLGQAPSPLVRFSSPTGSATSLVRIPASRIVVMATYANDFWTLDPATGQTIHTFTGHKASVLALAVTADGKRIYSGSLDKTIRVWDVGTGRMLKTLDAGKFGIASLAFSPDGKRLFAGQSPVRIFDRQPTSVQFYDTNTHKLLGELPGHIGRISRLAVSDDGKRLASSAGDFTIRLWDVAKKSQTRVIRRVPGNVRALSFFRLAMRRPTSPAEIVLAIADSWSIHLWDAATGRQGTTLRFPRVSIAQERMLSASLLKPAGESVHRVLVTSTGGEARLFELQRMSRLQTYSHAGQIHGGLLTKDGIAVTQGNGQLAVWSADSNDPAIRVLTSDAINVTCFEVLPGKRVAVVGDTGGRLRLLDLETGKWIATFEENADGAVSSLAVSPDGTRMLSCTGKKVTLWDVVHRRPLGELVGHDGSVGALAFSPDGRSAATGSQDGTVRIWDLATRKPLRTFEGHKHSVAAAIGAASTAGPFRPKLRWFQSYPVVVKFSPDGKTVLSKSTSSAVLWDVETLKVHGSFRTNGGGVTDKVVFSRRGESVLTQTTSSFGAEKRIQLRSASDLQLIHEYRTRASTGSGILGLTFSPDERQVVALTSFGKLRILDKETGEYVAGMETGLARFSVVRFFDHGWKVILKSGPVIMLWDFRRIGVYRELGPQLKTAREVLAKSPRHAESLAIVGEWYALQARWSWAIDFLRKARDGGVTRPLLLARCLWQNGDSTAADLEEAAKLFEEARTKEIAPESYLKLCIAAVEEERRARQKSEESAGKGE